MQWLSLPQSQEATKASSATIAKGVKLGPSVLECQTGEYGGAAPFVTDEGELCWPLLFVYEEYRQRDFIEAFGEHSCLGEQLAQMFPPLVPPPGWDPSAAYTAESLSVYFAEEWAGTVNREGEWSRGWNDGATALARKYVEVDLLTPLKDLLLDPRLTVPQWPIFHVFARGSPFLSQFLEGRT